MSEESEHLGMIRKHGSDPAGRIVTREALVGLARSLRGFVKNRAGNLPTQPAHSDLAVSADELDEASSDAVMATALLGTYADPDDAEYLLARLLEIVGDVTGEPLTRYPAVLMLYAASAALIARKRLVAVRTLAVESRIGGARGALPGSGSAAAKSSR